MTRYHNFVPNLSSYPSEECPQCQEQFTRDKSGARHGYSIIGKGETLTLIRCEACGIEIPVPETSDASLTVTATAGNISMSLRFSH